MKISFIPTYVTEKKNITDFDTLYKNKKIRVLKLYRADDKIIKHYKTISKQIHPKYHTSRKNWINDNVRWKKTRKLMYHFYIDNVPQYIEGKYMCQTFYKNAIFVDLADVELAYQIVNSVEEFPFTVEKFSYNGFSGTHDKNVIMNYKAKFIRWSGDPGIMIMQCSDNVERRIPTYAVPGSFIIPRNKDYNNQTIFGHSSQS